MKKTIWLAFALVCVTVVTAFVGNDKSIGAGNQKVKVAEFIFTEYALKFEYLDTDDKSKDSIHYKDCGVLTIHYPGTWGDVEKCEIREGEGRTERKPTTLCILFKTTKLVRYREFPLDVFEDPNPKADKKWVLVNPREKITGVNLAPILNK